jgi:hypothetical protein
MKKWLLQWGPDHFDASHRDWLTHWTFYDQAHADKPQPDDVAVVWQSGSDGGVVAIARFTDRPAYEIEIKPDSGWAPEYVGTMRWVRDLVGGQKLERVPRSVLMDDPRVCGSVDQEDAWRGQPVPGKRRRMVGAVRSDCPRIFKSITRSKRCLGAAYVFRIASETPTQFQDDIKAVMLLPAVMLVRGTGIKPVADCYLRTRKLRQCAPHPIPNGAG